MSTSFVLRDKHMCYVLHTRSSFSSTDFPFSLMENIEYHMSLYSIGFMLTYFLASTNVFSRYMIYILHVYNRMLATCVTISFNLHCLAIMKFYIILFSFYDLLFFVYFMYYCERWIWFLSKVVIFQFIPFYL